VATSTSRPAASVYRITERREKGGNSPAGDREPVPVSFVSSHALLGGAELYLESLIDGLGLGWCRGVTCLENGPFVERLRSHGHRVDVLDGAGRTGVATSLPGLRRAVRSQRPCVVHANGIKAALACSLALRFTGLPILWIKHDFSFDRTLARLVAHGCREVVGCSTAVIEIFRDQEGSRVTVIPPGITVPGIDRGAARRGVAELLSCRPDDPLVVHVGRIDPPKGQLELLEAAPRILEQQPRTRFAFLGAEEPGARAYSGVLRARARELGLETAARFLGHRDDALRIMAGCDVVAIPSLVREGLPTVAVEAMGIGTPVVGYAQGALGETLGGCGRVVSPGDRTALGDAIIALLQEPERWRRASECGKARARERFALTRTVEAMRQRYRELGAPG
jgi:glycosyltransferase involved in cell wall biosynthesis